MSRWDEVPWLNEICFEGMQDNPTVWEDLKSLTEWLPTWSTTPNTVSTRFKHLDSSSLKDN